MSIIYLLMSIDLRAGKLSTQVVNKLNTQQHSSGFSMKTVRVSGCVRCGFEK